MKTWKPKPESCPMGEALPRDESDEPAQITDKELAEQAALHQEFVSATEGDEEFVRRTGESHEQAKRREFVSGSSVLDALKNM